MAEIIFYEKPGCINNNRQKKRLEAAGHQVIARNLLAEDWHSKPDQLCAFFADKPIVDWFNRSAPAIKQGLIDPATLDVQQAINLMIADPLLIRRPLMQVGTEKCAGFDEQTVADWIGLLVSPTQADLESCPKTKPSDCRHA